MGSSFKTPHFRQSDRLRNCGAACLAMVYHKYNKKGKIKDITSQISIVLPNGSPSCRNSLMVQHSNKMGFNCSVVSAKDIRKLIPLCLELGVDMIVSYHPQPESPAGHFSVVTGIDDEYVFVNDPSRDAPKGINFPIKINDLEVRMKADISFQEIVVDNTVMLLSPRKLNLPLYTIEKTLDGSSYSVELLDFTLNIINAYLDPVRDCWFNIDTATTPSCS